MTALDKFCARYSGAEPLHVTPAQWGRIVLEGAAAGLKLPDNPNEGWLLGRPVILTHEPIQSGLAEAARNYVEARREFQASTSRAGARQVLDLAWQELERAYDAESQLFAAESRP